jgi:hypothetical protein
MMKDRGVKSLVVEKRHSGDAYGLIAYRDVARSVIAEDGDIDLLNVYDIAQKPALQVSQHLEIRYLARLMIQYSVKSVLVIDNNELQGFVSDTDVVSQPDRPRVPAGVNAMTFPDAAWAGCGRRHGETPLLRYFVIHSSLLGLLSALVPGLRRPRSGPGRRSPRSRVAGRRRLRRRHRPARDRASPDARTAGEKRIRKSSFTGARYASTGTITTKSRCSAIPAMRPCANCCSAATRRTCSSPIT